MTDDTPKTIRERFKTLAELADERIDLAEAALLISAEENPDLDISFFLGSLDEMAKKFETDYVANSELGISVTALVQFIHQREGFTGNSENYYDPTNSYLDKVIENRSGIPISLALIHIILGEKLGIQVKGMKFPGRFLIKYGGDPYTIVDPFSGRVMSQADCSTLLKQLGGPSETLKNRYFETASNKDILIRMLDNLKKIFWQEKSWQKSRACIERQILLKPDYHAYTVQLGVISEMQGKFIQATQIYTQLLQESEDEQAKEMASKRLLSMQNPEKTIH